MADAIKMNLGEMQSVHVRIESSRHGIDALHPKLRTRSSKSPAMDEFENRIKDFATFLEKYVELLKKDSRKLEKAVLAFKDLDQKEATKYADAVSKSRKGISVKSATESGLASGGGSR